MATLREWALRLLGSVTRKRRDHDLEEELRLHMELAAEDMGRKSEPHEDGQRMARLRAGGVAQAMDALRDQRGLPWFDGLMRDFRHGVRALLRAPVFTVVAILTLALGLGLNTSIFSIVQGVLLRPLPYPRPSELMHFTTNYRPQFPVAVAEYLEFQRFNRSFADVGAFRVGEVNLATGDRAIRIRSAFVDSHLLNALGIETVQGRLFTAEDSIVSGPTVPGGRALTAPVALLSYALWQSAFGAGQVVGRSIEVDGRRLQVVGVMQRGADLMDNHTEIWLPLGFTDNEVLSRNSHNLTLIGRLRDGVTPASAQTELNSLIQDWRARTGITPGPGHEGHVFLPPGDREHFLVMTPLSDQILGGVSRAIWILQAAVALVLLIACANVANLLLARAETRQREFAVLAALGAARGRLIRKALVESVILSLSGGLLGVLLALGGVRALARAYPESLPRIGEVTVDLRVMLVSFTIALVCGLLFGLGPMIHVRLGAAAEALRSGVGGSIGGRRHRLQGALVMAEVGLAVIVVVSAGLLLRTVHNLTVVDAGFNRSSLATFSVTLPSASFDLVGRVRVYQRILEELRALPGVDGVSGVTSLPLDRQYFSNQTELTNSTAPTPTVPIDYQRIMTDFFDVTGIPIVQGRGFSSTDTATRGAFAIVNETLANTFWKGRNPVGQQLRPGGTTPWFTVIGVAKDVKQTGVDQPVGAEAYVFVDQLVTDSPTSAVTVSPTTINVLMRTAQPLTTLAPAIERVVHDVSPNVPVARLREMNGVFNESIGRPRLLAQLVALFSALAVMLAAVGIYGLLASMVVGRRREIGIRLALGAQRSNVLSCIMRRGLFLVSGGLVIGLVGALALTRLLASLLFEVQPTDGVTFVAAIPAIISVAAVACWVPAWRASRLNPVATLRED